jgi:hypothetical protein
MIAKFNSKTHLLQKFVHFFQPYCTCLSAASRCPRLDRRSGRVLGKTAARSGRCRRHRARTMVWAFRRSTETIICLWPTWMVKVLTPVATTWYGPALGAAKGFCSPATRALLRLSDLAGSEQLLPWVVKARRLVEYPARAAAGLGG